jgi:E3 ubiquitin-protein ligase NEDD4
VYYIDHNTRTTSLHPPPIEPAGSYDELDPLPPWWEMKILDDGRTVFVDHETKTTTLRDPRKTMLETPLAQFIRKVLYLQRILRRERWPGRFEIRVRKDHVFEDSFTIISNATVDDLRKRPSVILDGLQPGHHAM